MKNKGGRKSYLEELEIAHRYTALTEPFFKVLKKNLESEDKADQKWAVEQLGKAFVKMIPQDVTSGGKELPAPILLNVFSDDSNKESSTTQEED